MKSTSWVGWLLLVAMGNCATRAAAQEPTMALLHPLFQDHAVLQRDRPIPVWGQATPGDSVSVAFAGRTASTNAAADGRWHATLPPAAAGGPYEMSVRSGHASQIVRDVQIGDVWLCSGQSNMELPVWRALDAGSEIASTTEPGIRLFTVPKAAAVSPQSDFPAAVAWRPASPDTVRDFSAACFYFARELRKTVDVPMGLIQAAWGGSRIEAWTSSNALRMQGGLGPALDVFALYARDPAAAPSRVAHQCCQCWRQRGFAAAGSRGDKASTSSAGPMPPCMRRASVLVQASMREPPHAAWIKPMGTSTVFCSSRAK